MIDLTQAAVLGRGHERTCYLHPQDAGKVLKVARGGVRCREQNRIDSAYHAALDRRGVPGEHRARCHGLVATNLGPGLICDHIVDDGGNTARPLDVLLAEGAVGRTEAAALLQDLYVWLDRHGVVLADVGLGNLLCPRRGGSWSLVVVDGLGARHPGCKLWLRSRFPALARRKLRKQWPLVLEAWRTAPARKE